MKLKLTRHFQDMMSYRSIDINHVKAAIKEPDEKEEVYENKLKVSKNVGEKIIEVIYCKEDFRDKINEYLVITAYYL